MIMMDVDDGGDDGGAAASAPHLDAEHRRRLASMLRYIATIHDSSNSRRDSTPSPFVRTTTVEPANGGRGREDGEAMVVRGRGEDRDDAKVRGGGDDGGTGVVFDLDDFRRVQEICHGTGTGGGGDGAKELPSPFPHPPYSFYASEEDTTLATQARGGGGGGGRRGGGGGWSLSFSLSRSRASARLGVRNGGAGDNNNNDNAGVQEGGGNGNGSRPCWFRLTRLTGEEPPRPDGDDAAVGRYLDGWARAEDVTTKKLLSRYPLPTPPLLLGENSSSRPDLRTRLRSFVRRHRRYQRRDLVRRTLERGYDALFELASESASSPAGREVVWGLGNATCRRRIRVDDSAGDDSFIEIDGPLLEVRVEVELASDGAILLRPCEHVGVSLNREVIAALDPSPEVVERLNRRVAGEVDARSVSPGQPQTYRKILKWMAVELSSEGKFVEYGKQHHRNNRRGRDNGHGRLVVTDSWVLFHRPRPGNVCARDASALADRLMSASAAGGVVDVPRATLALTHGPGALHRPTTAPPAGNDSSRGNGSRSGMFLSLLGALLSGGGNGGDEDEARGEGDGEDGEDVTGMNGTDEGCRSDRRVCDRPLFPLPSSASQDRVAELLSGGAAAVVVVGPPGCGKTHSIANVVCSYLARGKRVLVTSRGAPALSVLRSRLPPSVRGLCVDVSASESSGMRHLQRAVEILADRVASSGAAAQADLCSSLRQTMDNLEHEIGLIDEELDAWSDSQRYLIQNPEVSELAQEAVSLDRGAPWLVATLSRWSDSEVARILQMVEALHSYQDDDDGDEYAQSRACPVTGFDSPPSDALISAVAGRAGAVGPILTNVAVRLLASMPIVGNLTGAHGRLSATDAAIGLLRVNEEPPKYMSDWRLVLEVLVRDRDMHIFCDDVLKPLVAKEGWPRDVVRDLGSGHAKMKAGFVDMLRRAASVKERGRLLNLTSDRTDCEKKQTLEFRRGQLTARLIALSEKLVEAKVMAQMNKTFSPEAQSALIKFAQLAGKAKFNRSAQMSKMSQRQQRHRQQYLKAFEQCVRYIPCWVLTSTQVSDYLPPDFSMFDLVVIDEASQSDINALPCMLRGKQWLVVGDGKQVSPTESFVSEDQIESLQFALPDSPFKESFLPGQSFFDLASQAFPSRRVVLTEHFRCAPEIIKYSNDHFYNGKLHPLRLPTSVERMTPSIVDVLVPGGTKNGKVNELECDAIVAMVKELVDRCEAVEDVLAKDRLKSIGIISLIGDEQSRLIRRRILNSIGPEKFKRHNILAGDPPAFQGAERDVIFLSMVVSPGRVPTQSQLMHAQRANVALSRARDRMVLVRSVKPSDIPSAHDVKLPILHFFSEHGSPLDVEDENSIHAKSKLASCTRNSGEIWSCDALSPLRASVAELLSEKLASRGFFISDMGLVWKGGLYVEDETSGRRAALCIEGAGESKRDWDELVAQQRAIERVGWKCYRIEALDLILDSDMTSKNVKKMLEAEGIIASPKLDQVSEAIEIEECPANNEGSSNTKEECNDNDSMDVVDESKVEDESEECSDHEDEVPIRNVGHADVVVISSDDEEVDQEIRWEETCANEAQLQLGDKNQKRTNVKEEEDEDRFQPGQYGDVVNIDFAVSDPATDKSEENETGQATHAYAEQDAESSPMNGHLQALQDDSVFETHTREAKGCSSRNDDEESVDDEAWGAAVATRGKRKRLYRKLDSYSRDGRWHPPRNSSLDEDDDFDWFDREMDGSSLGPDDHIVSNGEGVNHCAQVEIAGVADGDRSDSSTASSVPKRRKRDHGNICETAN